MTLLPLPHRIHDGQIQSNFEAIQNRWQLVSRPNLVTSLPVTTVDGTEIYLQKDIVQMSGGQKVIWHLRYLASIGDAYKWMVVGGAPIHLDDPAMYALGVTGWQDTTNAMWLQAPVAGLYDVDWGANYAMSNDPSGQQVGVGVSIAGATPTNDIASFTYDSSSFGQSAVRGLKRVTVTTAATEFRHKGYTNDGTKGNYVVNRYMQLRPIRLG